MPSTDNIYTVERVTEYKLERVTPFFKWIQCKACKSSYKREAMWKISFEYHYFKYTCQRVTPEICHNKLASEFLYNSVGNLITGKRVFHYCVHCYPLITLSGFEIREILRGYFLLVSPKIISKVDN